MSKINGPDKFKNKSIYLKFNFLVKCFFTKNETINILFNPNKHNFREGI
jgi:hypothetical protein